MIKVKDAVTKAISYFLDLMGEATTGVLLEEAELSDDRKQWLITLSAWSPRSKPPVTDASNVSSRIADVFGPDHTRIYRRFHVDAETGEVTAMKMIRAA